MFRLGFENKKFMRERRISFLNSTFSILNFSGVAAYKSLREKREVVFPLRNPDIRYITQSPSPGEVNPTTEKYSMDPLNTALAELDHSDPDIRELALDTIGTLNPQNAFAIIAPFVSVPDPEIRETADCNLGDIQDDRSIPVLISLAENDPIETVRAEALQALANYQSPKILQCLIDEINRKKQSRRPRQIIARHSGLTVRIVTNQWQSQISHHLAACARSRR